MRRTLPLALALAAGLAAAGCSTSPCQRLGEKLCQCTGAASDTCTTEIENQLKSVDTSSQTILDQCEKLLARCTQPTGADFCEWLRTDAGQVACGLAPEPASATTTTP